MDLRDYYRYVELTVGNFHTQFPLLSQIGLNIHFSYSDVNSYGYLIDKKFKWLFQT